MSRRSISSVVQQFLTEIQYYSDSEIESIITYLPNPAVANVTGVRRLLVELQSEYSNVNDVIECTQSQPVHQAGVGRGIKRLLNESDDQDSVKELTQTRKRKSVDVEEDESCYTTKLTKFVCPKGKDFFERMESLEDLNRYKESKEYQDVIENQLVRRGKEGRKLQNMVDAQEKIFQALDNLRDGNTNMLDSAALVSETVRMPTGADTIIIETEEDYLDSEEDGLRKENDQEKENQPIMKPSKDVVENEHQDQQDPQLEEILEKIEKIFYCKDADYDEGLIRNAIISLDKWNAVTTNTSTQDLKNYESTLSKLNELLASYIAKKKISTAKGKIRVPTGAETPDDEGSFSDIYDEFIHPFEGFYVDLIKWNWQELNTKLHGRFGYGGDIRCEVEEIPTAMIYIQQWIKNNPSEEVLAQTWLDKLKALYPVETANANDEDVVQTQYTDDGITNSQLLLASDIVEGQSVGILSRLKLDQVNNDTQELILTQTQAVVITQPDVEWVETVQNLVESCERGGSIIKSEILCKVTKDEDKVREVCGIVTEWNNHITSEALYCYDKNLEAYTKGLADIEMKELIEYRPGRPKVFETAKELNEWFQLNLKIQESLEDQSLAASYLARLKKFQILEQMFSSPKGEQQNFFNKHQKSRAKAEYLLMKFAVENHSLGLNILRFVNIPWSKFSACKEFRNFIDRNGLEFPVVAEPSFSKIKEVGEEIAQDDFVCTQDFKMNLTDRDLRTLDHNKWLNDQVIAHYGANLIATSSRTDFYLIHSTVFALGSNCRMVPVKNNFKVFAITANLQNQHWALVLIHLEHQKIFYVDSWPMNRKHHFYQDPTHFKKNGDVKVKFKALLTKIEDKQQSIKRLVFSIMGTNGFDVEKFDWVECVMPVQKNGNDCGVYVLKYLEDFLENEHELLDAWGQDQDMRSRYDGVKINEYRDHIKSILE